MRRKPLALISCMALLMGFSAAGMAQQSASNKAARIRIIQSVRESKLAGRPAPPGKTYLVLETEWENVHPKKKVKKSDLEGKPDRTMGVQGLTGKTKETQEELVDADVAYAVPNLYDHVYCLADGQSFALHDATKEVPGGANPRGGFAISKLSEKKPLSLVFLIPDSAENLAFQLFDYAYGHIFVPIQGDLELARGAGGAPAKALGSVKDEMIELAALRIDLRPDFEDEKAPEGWRYAVVELGGKSLSKEGRIGNIVQIKPTEYIWLQTDGGFLYYCAGATTTEAGYLRFTPEVFQTQQLRFLIPAVDEALALGIRVQNKVHSLLLSPDFSMKIPKAVSSHRDGKTMDIQVYGARRGDKRLVLDLGIQSLVASGIEIQARPQFMLETVKGKVAFDGVATAKLVRRPPKPFIIPPQSFVRFELAYEIEGTPGSLHYRGFQSEGKLAIPGLK